MKYTSFSYCCCFLFVFCTLFFVCWVFVVVGFYIFVIFVCCLELEHLARRFVHHGGLYHSY